MKNLIADIAEAHGTHEIFAPHTTFIRQGADMPYMYYVQAGRVKVEQSMVNGKSILFAFVGGENWLGDLELFSDSNNANSTVTTIGEIEVIRFPLQMIRQLIRQDPALTEMFARSLAKKMWAYSKISAVNLLYPLLERYAAYLYEMSSETMELPIALENSAGLLGAGERQLQRALRELAERGIIRRDGRKLIVIDRERLKTIAGELANIA